MPPLPNLTNRRTFSDKTISLNSTQWRKIADQAWQASDVQTSDYINKSLQMGRPDRNGRYTFYLDTKGLQMLKGYANLAGLKTTNW